MVRAAAEDAEPSVEPPLDASSATPDAQATHMDEDAIAAQALLREAQMDDAERYRRDVVLRAEQASDDAYESMPIEEFGKAMLRGMGWEEGKGYNGKAPVEPIEYVARPQLLGLAATPAPESGQSRQKKYIKPGESREKKKDMIYVDEHGRQRHVKKVGEKLVERGPTMLQPEALVAIESGPHKDLYARIVSIGGMASDMRAVVRLTGSKEIVSLRTDDVRLVKDVQLEKRKHKSGHHRKQDDKRDTNVGGHDAGSSEARRHKKSRHDRERGGDRDHVGGSKGDRVESSRDYESSDRAGNDYNGSREMWVRENIRVRIIDKRLQGGALYNKKGVVEDVSGVNTFSLRLDDSCKLVEGLRKSQVETVLPKRAGAAVVVVDGKYKLRRGRLVERHTKDARAVIQLTGDFELITLSFDDIAEWVGPEDELE